MPQKKVFISFDYHNDRNYRYLLQALAKNAESDIEFEDLTPEEIQSYEIDRVKSVLTSRIRSSTHTLVIIGNHANTYHEDREEIGERNWQWWEIEKSYEEGNNFIAVKIDPSNNSPDPLYNKGATWANSFKVESILNAINNA
jgi:hypothetical protein